MKIELTNCSPTIERKQESCVFEIEDPKPHCVLCGRRCSHTKNNSHPGPVITVSGWFEAKEYHDPAAVELFHGGEQLFADFLIHSTACELIDSATWRYPFHGQKYVGVDKVVLFDSGIFLRNFPESS